MSTNPFSHRRTAALAGLLAGAWFTVALLAFALRVPGYDHAMQTPALLGATGMPDARAWNLLGFLVPGLMAAYALQGLHRVLRARDAGFVARVGMTLLLLSAVAFAAQGLLPLQLGRAIDAGSARLHIVAWTLWWLAAIAGFVVLALGQLRKPLSAIAALMAATLMGAALHASSLPLPGGVRERIALAAWFGWIALASWQAWRAWRPWRTWRAWRQP
jgi:hypothetical protein